jgi:hypothetical protein
MSCQTIDESHKRVCFNSYDSFFIKQKIWIFFSVFQNEWLCQHVLRLGRRRRWPTSSDATTKFLNLSELANHLKILHAVSWACKSFFFVLLLHHRMQQQNFSMFRSSPIFSRFYMQFHGPVSTGIDNYTCFVVLLLHLLTFIIKYFYY